MHGPLNVEYHRCGQSTKCWNVVQTIRTASFELWTLSLSNKKLLQERVNETMYRIFQFSSFWQGCVYICSFAWR